MRIILYGVLFILCCLCRLWIFAIMFLVIIAIEIYFLNRKKSFSEIKREREYRKYMEKIDEEFDDEDNNN